VREIDRDDVADQAVADLQNLASGGGDAPHGKFVHLYINGLYWGLYDAHERPDDSFPRAIVMHATVGEAIPSLNWLANPASEVSVHYLVDRDGTVYQMVSEDLRAWHAGPSYYNGINDWNSFSVGIEMVNRNDGVDPYSPALMASVKNLVHRL